jgi:hypothetical protein
VGGKNNNAVHIWIRPLKDSDISEGRLVACLFRQDLIVSTDPALSYSKTITTSGFSSNE